MLTMPPSRLVFTAAVVALSACLLPEYQGQGAGGAGGVGAGSGGTGPVGAAGGSGAAGASGGMQGVCPEEFSFSFDSPGGYLQVTDAIVHPDTAGIVIAGSFTGQYGGLQSLANEQNLFLSGLDPAGNRLWSHHIHSTAGYMRIEQMIPTPDGGVVVALTNLGGIAINEEPQSADVTHGLVIRFGGDGVIAWQQTIACQNPIIDALIDTVALSNDRLLVGGTAGGGLIVDTEPVGGIDESFLFVLELDASTGVLVDAQTWNGFGKVAGIAEANGSRFVFGHYSTNPPVFGVEMNPPPYASPSQLFVVKFPPAPEAPSATAFGFTVRDERALEMLPDGDGFVIAARVGPGDDSPLEPSGPSIAGERQASMLARVTEDLVVDWITLNETTVLLDYHFEPTALGRQAGGYVMGHLHTIDDATTHVSGSDEKAPLVDSILIHYDANGLVDGLLRYPDTPKDGGGINAAFIRAHPTPCGDLTYGYFFGKLMWGGVEYNAVVDDRSVLAFQRAPGLVFNPL